MYRAKILVTGTISRTHLEKDPTAEGGCKIVVEKILELENLSIIMQYNANTGEGEGGDKEEFGDGANWSVFCEIGLKLNIPIGKIDKEKCPRCGNVDTGGSI